MCELICLSNLRFLLRENCVSAVTEEVNVFVLALVFLVCILTNYSLSEECVLLMINARFKSQMVDNRKWAHNSLCGSKVCH